MDELSGRTAFVTGGAQGIGLGIAQSLAAAGMKIALVDLDAERLSAAAGEVDSEVAIFPLDVTDRGAFAEVADAAERQLGPVSVLVNNAGVFASVPVDASSYELWDWMLGVNLGGVVNGFQTFLPRLLARGGPAHVVTTASAGGLAGMGGGTYMYATSKFAVVGLCESYRAELAPRGIGVSVLLPGPVTTDLAANSARHAPSATPLVSPVSGQRPRLTPRAAGDLVLAGIRSNSLYIHTDRVMAEPVRARTAAILDAMPPV